MRILVVSNLYPPYFIGGYELGCRDIVEGLRARGHEVRVLTSTYGVNQPEIDSDVYRWLEWDGWNDYGTRLARSLRVIAKEAKNRSALERVMRTYRPDVVYVWNLRGVSVSLVFLAQQLGLPVCYFVSDDWLSRWESDLAYSFWFDRRRQSLAAFTKARLRPLFSLWNLVPSGSLDLRRVQFASEYLRKITRLAGKPVEAGEVVHWCVDTQKFRFRKQSNSSKRLLYAGAIVPHKGVDTAIKALGVLAQSHAHGWEKLTIMGSAKVRPDYGLELQRLVRSYGLGNRVCFGQGVSREQLLQIYQEHDILLFPSVWEEPFSITLLEAMSCGLAIVATATGGTPEILKHESNALVFPKNSAAACAGHIERLLDNDELFDRIRSNGRRTVELGFRLESMIDRVERLLIKAAEDVTA
jgi:glycogen(starch) synthase